MIANKEKKSISRSIRMTPTVYNIVSSFDGDGFNEKFENLVMFCFNERPHLEQEIKVLTKKYDAMRDKKAKEIERLDNLISQKKAVSVTLDIIGAESNNLLNTIRKITSDDL